jgi:Na+/H+-dicarboxylate symporter
MFVVYVVLLFIFVRKLSFLKFFKALRRAQILAFSSSSSAATLPVTMECVEEMGVSRQMSSFVLPIGATVNMDGTSLYLSVAIVFLAQFHLVDLGMEQLFLLAFTVIMASVGTAAVPSASLVMMIVVLEALGLNPIWMALVIPVDRLLDMLRTVVNITGDASVATIVAATEGELDYSKTVEQ